MLHIPDPLHPFAVHFPVAFLCLGAAAALGALFFARRTLGWFAAALLALGALGAQWAYTTGVEDALRVRYVTAATQETLRAHQREANGTRLAAAVAAAAGLAAALAMRVPGVSLLARLLCVAAAGWMLWTMQETLHSGSRLTHEHLFGTNAPKPPPGTEEMTRVKVE